MFEIVVATEFKKRYQLLPLLIRKKAQKQERLFVRNPFHPSLHAEKLEPRERQLWSFRIDRKYRIVFRFLDQKQVLFMTVGQHDWVYQFLKR